MEYIIVLLRTMFIQARLTCTCIICTYAIRTLCIPKCACSYVYMSNCIYLRIIRPIIYDLKTLLAVSPFVCVCV